MDDKLYVWDLQKGQVLRCFAGHTAQVKCAAVVGRCTQAPRVVSASSSAPTSLPNPLLPLFRAATIYSCSYRQFALF